MHTPTRFTVALTLLAFAGCHLALGLDEFQIEDAETAGTGGGSGSGRGGTGGDDGGGGDVPPPPECVPSGAEWEADPSCGVFVSLGGDDINAGTPASPLATIDVAVNRADANTKRVYVCAETFVGPVNIPGGISVYGGLACGTNWEYVVSPKTTIAGPSTGAALTIQGAGSSSVEDVAVQAADASMPGGSSVAVFVNGADVQFARCDLTAGEGRSGDDGANGPAVMAQAEAGNDGGDACPGGNLNVVVGASAKQNPVCISSYGGGGGDGNLVGPGDDGSSGGPGTNVNAGKGENGVDDCQNGQDGNAGAIGGNGAAGTGNGSIDASGYKNDGGVGGTGGIGAPGQGGGGGGGRNEVANCTGNSGAGPGASGGSGGPGGCGGMGAEGGYPGGSSIALMSFNATIALSACTLTASNGANGGRGGRGQDGQLGGKGGNGNGGSLAACDGGNGGTGGNGGYGGGGRGGHSLGIAYVGTAPSKDASTTISLGDQGPGGVRGDGMGNAGMPGEAEEMLEF